MDDAAISLRVGLVLGAEGALGEAIADRLRADGVTLADVLVSGTLTVDVLVFIARA